MSPESFKDHFGPGSYCCKQCGQELFSSNQKLPPVRRHPSFQRPIRGAVKIRPDFSVTPVGTKVLCLGCDQFVGRLHNDRRLQEHSRPETVLRFEAFASAIILGAHAEVLVGTVLTPNNR